MDKTDTINALKNPEVGDLFSEMCHFWMTVIKVDKNRIYTYEKTPGYELYSVYNRETYLKRFSYGSGIGSWIKLHERGTSVDKYMAGLKEFEEEIIDDYISSQK